MHIRFFSSFLILFIFYSSLVAQEIDLEAGAGNNIGRLEEDDGDEEEEEGWGCRIALRSSPWS